MNFSELTANVAAEMNISKKKADAILKTGFDVIHAAICQGIDVRTPIGAFTLVGRKATTKRNPQTGETVHVPEKQAVRFKPNKSLKDAIN